MAKCNVGASLTWARPVRKKRPAALINGLVSVWALIAAGPPAWESGVHISRPRGLPTVQAMETLGRLEGLDSYEYAVNDDAIDRFPLVHSPPRAPVRGERR